MRLCPLQGKRSSRIVLGTKRAKRSKDVFHGVRHNTESLLSVMNCSDMMTAWGINYIREHFAIIDMVKRCADMKQYHPSLALDWCRHLTNQRHFEF